MQGEAARVKALLEVESSKLTEASQLLVQFKAEAQASRLLAEPPSLHAGHRQAYTAFRFRLLCLFYVALRGCG